MDSVDVWCFREPFGDSVTLTAIAVSHCLSKPVETDMGIALIDFSHRSEGRGVEALLLDVLPVTVSCWVEMGSGGAGDGFLDCSYRLGCGLWDLYRLVPKLDVSVTGWGWGSVTGGASVRGEVGAVRDVDIVPKLIGINLSWGWWSGVPVLPRIVTGGWFNGSGVTAHIKSPLTRGESGVCAG